MYFAEDENFARRLQHELQAYDEFNRQKGLKEKENLNPVDSVLEYIDPTPSIQDLFVKFDKKFFWNTLGMVEVVWSTRMTMCAGVCSFQGRSGLCKISLSAPLLTLRPRKDLVETLLHEMIHAYLFITNNYRDRDDHGPEFHKHMYRINREAGTNITVYHTFHDEVEYYQRHIWRCDGPCRLNKPYYGFVKRVNNRAPGPHEKWWSKHQQNCGGKFIKIQEPEKKPRKKKVNTVKPKGKISDIRDFFTPQMKPTENQKTSNIKTLADLKGGGATGMKTNSGTGTLVVTNNNSNKRNNPQKPVQNKRKKTNNSIVTSSVTSQKTSSDDKVRETVRNVWANKFSNTKVVDKPEPKINNCDLEILEHKSKDNNLQHLDSCVTASAAQGMSTDADDEVKHCPICSADILQSEMNDHIENCLECSFVNDEDLEEIEESVDVHCESVPCPCCYKWFKESEMNDHIDECLTLNALKEEIVAL